jgi:uncharacterized membrane protein
MAIVEAVLNPAGSTQGRSFLKTVTWRAIAAGDTFLIGWLITGNLAFAGSIASIEVLTKMGLYYMHERAWARVDWGAKGRVL